MPYVLWQKKDEKDSCIVPTDNVDKLGIDNGKRESERHSLRKMKKNCVIVPNDKVDRLGDNSGKGERG